MELRGFVNTGLARAVTARAGWWALAALLAVTALRLGVAGLAPLAPDEAYYWVWSRALAPGYLDHPPMVALWIRAGTALLGATPLGVRLLGPLSAALAAPALYRAARDLLPDPRRALACVVLLNATLLFGAGSITMTPDTPLLFFWTLALWATARLIATCNARWWPAIGLCCGLSLASKYTGVFLPLALALWLVWARQWHWLRQPVTWLALPLGLLPFAPVVWWNAHHGWASFAKQGARNLAFVPARAARYLAELIAGQVGLVTPLILALCAIGIVAATRRAVRRRDPAATLLACLALVPAAVFAEHALGDRVQANWPAVIYPAAVIAAGYAGAKAWRGLWWPGVALGAVMTALIYLQSSWPVVAIPRGLDPTLRLAGYRDLAAQVRAAARVQGARFVAADDYGLAALLAFDAPGCAPVVGIENRWALFALPGPRAFAGSVGLIARTDRRHGMPASADWLELSKVGAAVRQRGGVIAEHYTLYRGRFSPGSEPAVLLPCAGA